MVRLCNLGYAPKMNWRLFVGGKLERLRSGVVASHAFPLTRYYPYGRYLYYDAQRFAGTRHFEIIFDVGANIGQSVVGFQRWFPQATVYAFEPVAASFEVLCRRFGRYPNMHFSNVAVGDQVGEGVIYTHAYSQLDTMVSDSRSGASGEQTISVTTIDTFCEGHGVEHIDLLKIDVQGWELNVLRGAKRMLSERRVRFAKIEAGFHRRKDTQDFGRLNDFMVAGGYVFCGLYDVGQRRATSTSPTPFIAVPASRDVRRLSRSFACYPRSASSSEAR